MRIAFHAPLKAPDHPVPSGDREMARLLVAALRHGGHETSLPSPLRSFARSPDAAALAALEAASAGEVQRLLAHWQGRGAAEKPELWLTYHLYYKAPDLIGPAIARALHIPYVLAEASHAPKRNFDGWQPWQAYVEAALAAADAVFSFTARDREGLERLPYVTARLVDLPPFTDAATRAAAGPRTFRLASGTGEPEGSRFRLLAIAMMRAGDKLRSYLFLAQALALLPGLNWHLGIIGDGPARPEVEAAFAGFPPQNITFNGAVPGAEIPAHLATASLLVWPGFGEAYGMVYLEAQAAGVPVLALDQGGVASTMQAGMTGVLVPRSDPADYAAALTALLDNRAHCREMGAAARSFILKERSLPRAAKILDTALQQALLDYPK